jgi:hypothetical protein
MLVSENTIDSIAEKVESKELNIDDFIETFSSEQEELWNYIEKEIFPVLTKEETDYLLFISFIIYESIIASGIEIKEIDLNNFQEIEESNWLRFEESKSKMFKAKLDVFFKDYEEEDILAFIEDMLTLEEEDVITPIGREPIFVFCKSFADICIKH